MKYPIYLQPRLYLTKTSRMSFFAVLLLTLTTSPVVFCKNVLIDANHSVSQTGILIGGGGGPIGPSTEPDDPNKKPRSPSQPGVVDNGLTNSSIALQWTDNSSYELGFRLYRGPDYAGPWTQIASFGASPGNTAVMTYTDTLLPRDTRFYYRVEAYNAHGESFSVPQTFNTKDGRGFSRLQLRLHTSNVSDANTDDDVNVSLRDYDNGGTWLDYGRNDFERGDIFTYELLPHGLSDLSDINNIYLLKPGTDGWCVESLALLADGVEIYNQQLATITSPCQWMDDENGHQTYFVVGRNTLRSQGLWQTYQQPIPSTRLLRTDLESRIESMVGNIIHYGVPVDAFPIYQGTLGVYWTGDALDGESHVKITKKDSQAVHVAFKLDVDTPGPGGITGSIDFDIRFTATCRTATTPVTIEMKSENVHATADFDWTTEAMTLWLVNFLEDGIANKIKNSFPNLSQVITIKNEIVSCVTPFIEDDGTVDFDLTFAKRTGTGGGGIITGTQAVTRKGAVNKL